MKCNFCGKELENGAEICPECGMILSIGGETADEANPTVESVMNVFRGNAQSKKAEPVVPAQEIPVDPLEETVEIVETLPEFDSDAFAPVKEDAEPVDIYSSSTPTLPADDIADINDTADDADVSDDFVSDDASDDSVSDDASDDSVSDDASDDADDASVTDDSDADDEITVPELDIRVPTVEVTYPEYEAYKLKKQQDEDEAAQAAAEKKAADEFDEHFDHRKDTVVKDKKRRKKNKGKSSVTVATFLFALIAVAVVCCGAYFMKSVIPSMLPDSTTKSKVETSADNKQTTDKDSTKEDTTNEEDTTAEEETTSEDTTDEDETTSVQAVKPDDTTEATTKPTTTKPSTTKPTTTKPTTTKPSTTKPTTKPSTTKPTTTKPTTTDRYGINDVTVKKPSSYLANSFTVYATAEGVNLRSGPATTYDRVLFLSKGANLTVYAESSGFYYVRSNRYGVYGWVSKEYASKTRPVESTTTVSSGTVSPDKKYSEVQLKNTTDGLNLRKGPSTSYDVVILIPKGYPVKVIGYKAGVSGWVYVTDTTYGYSGWVSSAYIK